MALKIWNKYFIFIYLLILQISKNRVWNYNVETEHYTFYRGMMQSKFGYSVALYRDQNHKGWVIIGAPNNITDSNGVGGGVAQCDISTDQQCYDIKFDKIGTKKLKEKNGFSPIDNKADQWLGATLSTSVVDGGPIVACAPKYNWFGYIKTPTQKVAGLKDAVGACWLTTMNGESIEFSPCRNNDTSGHHRQGMCQAGSSVSVTKDGKRLFIGAPGSWYWQGQLFTMSTDNGLPYFPPKSTPAGTVNHTKITNVLSTHEGPPYEDNNYLGYSVSVGNFFGLDDSGVAVGVPRGLDLNGKVLLFTSQLVNHLNISGHQMGAYFGYALAVIDIDGDSLDDLIITAPFYTQPELTGVKIETGRIYVYYQGNGQQKFNKFDTRDGDVSRGHFGLSIASLGDIDRDGYGDFVVGEPYGGLENRGAVYIFKGSETGVEEKYSQVIYSENLEQPVRTFGWSVNGGMDLDNNLYNDLVVGAYESDSALFFRSRPVIKIISTIQFDSDLINLKNLSCVLRDGQSVACSELKVCCLYSGEGTLPQHDFVVHITLDDKKKKNPRLFFQDLEDRNIINSTVKMSQNKHWCNTYKVYVNTVLRDKLTSLDAEMHVELAKYYKSKVRSRRNPKERLLPILGLKNTRTRTSLSIQKNCGPDNICIPDLVLRVSKNVERYPLGSRDKLELNVVIHNQAEDAYESSFYLHLPAGIDYINWVSQMQSSDISIQCTAPKLNNNNTIRCDIGNPLPEGKTAKFKIILQPITYDGMKPDYELIMNVNSTNPEKPETKENNQVKINLPLWIENNLIVESQSKPQVIDLNSVDYANIDPKILQSKLEYAPSVVHNYTIRNNGPSRAINITTELIWIAQTFSNYKLLYLLEQPEASKAKVHCDCANSDPESIKNKIKIVKNFQSKPDTCNGFNKFSKGNDDYVKSYALCKFGNCVSFQCHAGPLEKDEEITIAVKYLVNVTSAENITNNVKDESFDGNPVDRRFKIATKLIAKVTSLPYIGAPQNPSTASAITETYILPAVPVLKEETPLWIWILSAIAGIIILIIFILCLKKCGFFKRNRPSMGPEREPLNGS